MVQYQEATLDTVFQALSDGTRRAMVERLSHGNASVSELAEPFTMSLPAVMKHVRVLESAGLVSHRKVGRTRICELAGEPLGAAEDWLRPYRVFWERNLDALAQHFAAEMN